ncbi:MAG: hypothetical protein JEZ03_07665 [Bacteroidales bacterium]|nr:hypothetical protein [Bacteroidales bacterium]
MLETTTSRRELTKDCEIPIATAIDWVRRWKHARKDQLWWAGHVFNAFLIPHNDLQGILDEGATDARAYMGINEREEIKLILVGVDANGKDMIDADLYPVYDFTTPCPPICDLGSLLNSAE